VDLRSRDAEQPDEDDDDFCPDCEKLWENCTCDDDDDEDDEEE